MIGKQKIETQKSFPLWVMRLQRGSFFVCPWDEKTEKTHPFGSVQAYRLRYSTRGLPPVEYST